MAALTVNASHRKAFKAGNWTRPGCNTYGQIHGGRSTRSRRHWLDKIEREDNIDREAVERKQTEARKRRAAELQVQLQSGEAGAAKRGLFSRTMSFLRRLAKAA